MVDSHASVIEFKAGSFSYHLNADVNLTHFSLYESVSKAQQEFKSDVFVDDRWHSIVLRYQIQNDSGAVLLECYFDGKLASELKSTVKTENKENFLLPQNEAQILIGNGLDGMVRDLAFWRRALAKNHTTAAATSGIYYTADDWLSDTDYRGLVVTYNFDAIEKEKKNKF